MRSAAKKNLAPLEHAGALRANHSQKETASRFAWFDRGANGLSKTEATLILRHLATLTSNGVPLPKAIGAVASERGLEKRRPLLEKLRRQVESGDAFSHALGRLDPTFDQITVSQIRVGERAGTLSDTLLQVAAQREKAGKIKESVIKKLAYPAVLAMVGAGVVAFLLCYVVPVFDETYDAANVPLPGITQSLIVVGEVAQAYWWVAPILAVAVPLLIRQLRKNESVSQRIDAWLLRLPLIGGWLRDVALLQLMEVLGGLMEAGFTLADSLDEAAESVGNRAMKSGVVELSRAVHHGERFSREVERLDHLFPPMVSQLVIVGEQTGRLTKSTQQIRVLLEEEIQRKTDVAIGVIEPTLTISMASAVAVILLAIYLPMFDMINTVG